MSGQLSFRLIFISGHAMKALANNTISVARNSKAKSKSFRTKSRKKNYLVFLKKFVAMATQLGFEV